MQLTILAWRWDPNPLEQDYGSALDLELYDEVSRAAGDRHARQDRPKAHLADIENELC